MLLFHESPCPRTTKSAAQGWGCSRKADGRGQSMEKIQGGRLISAGIRLCHLNLPAQSRRSRNEEEQLPSSLNLFLSLVLISVCWRAGVALVCACFGGWLGNLFYPKCRRLSKVGSSASLFVKLGLNLILFIDSCSLHL